MATKTAAKKKTATKKAATKTTKTAVKKTKKTATRAPAAKKATTKKAAAKPAKKTAAKKTAAPAKTKKGAPAAKPAAKKTATKKAAPKKATAKKTAKKAAAKPAEKKNAAAKEAPAKKATKATKKTAAKKTKKAASKKTEAARPKPKPANVGQAPRKTTFAASIPVPSQIMEKDDAQADITAGTDNEAQTAAKQDFKLNDKIVYPAHGVGRIVGLEKQQVAGLAIELFVIDFDQEKMKLRVPTGKAKAAGMRPLSDDKTVKDAIETLKGRARIKRTMWSRRAQEYDAKINSGSLKLVAEVVRDLFRASDQPEQSYSERQLFEAALDRMAREVAAVRKVDLGAAIAELEGVLHKKAAA